MSKKKSYMDRENVVNENFINDFFKKIFGKNKNDIYKNFKNHPDIKPKIKKAEKLAKQTDKIVRDMGYVWKPSLGGYVRKDKKTGKWIHFSEDPSGKRSW